MRGENPLPHTRRKPCGKSQNHQRHQGSGVVRWTLTPDGAVVATRWNTLLPEAETQDSGSQNPYGGDACPMAAKTKTRQHCTRDTATDTTGTPGPCTTRANDDTTACIRPGVTGVTRISNTATSAPTVTALHGHVPATSRRPPPRGATAHTPSLVLRDAIFECSLLLANRFRVIRTVDIAAACFPERPFKAALTAAQRAVRGLVKADLLRRYRTDRFQTVYGLTQRGVDWLAERGYDASSSVRRVSEMTNPEHQLWSQFLVACSWARGLEAYTEKELLRKLTAAAKGGKASTAPQGYLKVHVQRSGGSASKWLRPDAIAYEGHGNGVVWFEVDRSKRGSSRQADLTALISAIGSKCADGKTLRRVVVMCKSERIERDALRVVEQLASANNELVLTEGRRHIRESEPGVYDVWTAMPFKRDDGRTVLVDERVGHVIVQMLPTWLPKVRIDATNQWSTDGWFGDNYLPFKRPPATGRWEMPVSPLCAGDDEKDGG